MQRWRLNEFIISFFCSLSIAISVIEVVIIKNDILLALYSMIMSSKIIYMMIKDKIFYVGLAQFSLL